MAGPGRTWLVPTTSAEQGRSGEPNVKCLCWALPGGNHAASLCHMSFGFNIKLLCSSGLSKRQMWGLICAWPPPLCMALGKMSSWSPALVLKISKRMKPQCPKLA